MCNEASLFAIRYKTEEDCTVTETTGTVYVNVYVHDTNIPGMHIHLYTTVGRGGRIYKHRKRFRKTAALLSRPRKAKSRRSLPQPNARYPTAAAPPAGAGPGLHQPLRFLRAWITQRASLWRRRIEETAQEEENGINNPAVAAASGTLQRLTEGPDFPPPRGSLLASSPPPGLLDPFKRSTSSLPLSSLVPGTPAVTAAAVGRLLRPLPACLPWCGGGRQRPCLLRRPRCCCCSSRRRHEQWRPPLLLSGGSRRGGSRAAPRAGSSGGGGGPRRAEAQVLPLLRQGQDVLLRRGMPVPARGARRSFRRLSRPSAAGRPRWASAWDPSLPRCSFRRRGRIAGARR